MKKKSLLLILLMVLLAPWAAQAQQTAPYNEGFEDMSSVDDLNDAGWEMLYKSHSGSFLKIETSASNVFEGSHALDIDSWNAGSTSDWVIVGLPIITNKAVNELQMTFSYKVSTGNVYIGYLTDPDDYTTFNIVESFNSSSSYTTKLVEFGAAPAEASRIAIKYLNYYRCYVDAFEIKQLSNCKTPQNLTASNLTTDRVTLTWERNAAGSEDAWIVEYATNSDFTGATSVSVTGGTPTKTLNGLTENTKYYARVKADCGGEESDPTAAISFTTLCEATTIPTEGWGENFDSYTHTSNTPTTNNLPDCWSYINTTTYSSYQGYPYVYYASSTSHSGNYHLRFYSYYSSWGSYDPQPQYAILPPMDNLTGKQITLWARGYNTSSTFKIGTMTDPSDVTTFTAIAEQTLTTTYEEFTYPLSGTNVCVAIMIDAANSSISTNSVYIDDIVINDAPNCVKPVSLNVEATLQTATFTWTSDASQWQVAYSKDATADPSDNIVGLVDVKSFTKDNLELDTDHYFWVRTYCGTSEQSDWAGPVSVHIGYCVPAPTSVDKNGITNITFGTGENIVNNNTHPTAQPYYGNYSDQIGAVQAGVEASIAITYATGYTYNTYVWVDLDNSLSFESDEVICYGESTSANPTTLTLTFTLPANQATGDYRMRIGGADSGLGSNPANANPCYSSSYAIFEDYTLRVLEAPSCFTPTNLTHGTPAARSVVLSWTPGAEETQWQVCVNDKESEAILVNTNPYTLDELNPETEYTVKVRAYCSSTDQSLWSEPTSFTTDVACHVPTGLAASEITAHSAKMTWTSESETSNLRYRKVEGAAPATIILTTDDVWGDGSGYQMLIDADATAYAEVYEAGLFGSDCNVPATLYDPFEYTIPTNADPSCTTANFICNSSASIQVPAGIYDILIANPTPGDRIWIASDGGNIGGKIDDYEFEAGKTYEFHVYNGGTNDATDVTITDAKNIRAPKAGDWTVVSGVTSPYTIPGLDADANYEVQVQAACGGDNGNSAWSESKSFKTLESCLKPSNLQAGTPQPTSVELSWTENGEATAWQIAYGEDKGDFDPDGVTPLDVDTNPYTLTGLTAEVDYIAYVRANCGDEYSSWCLTPVHFTTPSACDAPVNLAADALHTTATLSWEGFQDTYNIQYMTAPYTDIVFEEGFESGNLGEWTTVNLESGGGVTSSSNATHSGSYGFAFKWTTNTPQYLVSPKLTGIENGSTLNFYCKNYSASYLESFKVGYSTTSNDVTDDSAFTWSDETTMPANTTWQSYSQSIPEGTMYIAIQCTSYDKYYLYIDDITITGAEHPAGTPIIVNNVTSPYEINSLTAGTDYIWKVQGNCKGSATTDWAEDTFTTLAETQMLFVGGDPADPVSWSDAANWEASTAGSLPDITTDVIIAANVVIPADVVAYANTITLVTRASITIQDEGNGHYGQLKTNTNGLQVKVQKKVAGYGTGNGNWTLLSTPLNSNTNPTNVTNMLEGDHDLFQFNGSYGGAEWRNYIQSAFNMSTGNGYLYANKADQLLEFTGTTWRSYNSNLTMTAYYYAPTTTNPFYDWKLVGNTFVCNGYLYQINSSNNIIDANFYVMNTTGDGYVLSESSVALAPCEGAFTQLNSNVSKVLFSSEVISTSKGGNGIINMYVAHNNKTVDMARIRFGEGYDLGHMSFRDNSSKLYIPQDDKNYAVVYTEAEGSMPLNFKAETTGNYTISFKLDGANIGYLHLFDKLTGNDVNLLADPTYSFVGSPRDNENRFIVKFSDNSGDDIFAYQSGDEIIVNGEGELQIFDVMGRFVGNMTVNGSERISASSFANGVYVFRMVGNEVKTQKIVVR